MNARTLITANGVITCDENLPLASWLVIRGDVIDAVGLPGSEPPDLTPAVHVDGWILPGLIDAHVHLTTTGLYGSGLDFRQCRSVPELIDLLGRYLQSDASDWVIGGNFDPGRNRDARMPTSAELDAVAGDRFLLVSRADGHSCTLSSKGFAQIGLDPGLIGIEIEDGRPTGVLADQANYEARRRFFSSLPTEKIRAAQAWACALAVSRGATSLHEMAGGTFMGDKDVEVLLSTDGDHHGVHINIYLATLDVDAVLSMGLDRIGGDMFLDGSIGSKTAAMSQPYQDHEGTGHLYHDDDEITEYFFAASKAGIQAGVHAIGDAAIEQALRCIDGAFARLSEEERSRARALRHRIEHFECVAEGHLERAAALGIAASVQPMFDRYWGGEGGMYEARLGPRSRSMNPFRSMEAAGLVVAGGSDSTVTPLDPFQGMAAAMTHSNPDEALDLEAAMRMFTIGAAIAGHDEDTRGSLVRGKRADLCALETDPRVCTPDDLARMRVLATWAGGKQVFSQDR